MYKKKVVKIYNSISILININNFSYNMEEKLKNILAEEIKNTKTLNSLNQDYIKNKLEKYLLTYGQDFKKLKIIASKKGLDKIEKNKIFKLIVKAVRDELRVVYGSFLTNDFFTRDINESTDELFKCHKSTKERMAIKK